MTKRTRKIKPYPAVVPDDVKPAEKGGPSLWAEHTALAILLALFVIFPLLAGVAGYVWGMVR